VARLRDPAPRPDDQFEETTELLSALRLGVNLKLIPGVPIDTVNELFIVTQPSHLQKIEKKLLQPGERDEAARSTSAGSSAPPSRTERPSPSFAKKPAACRGEEWRRRPSPYFAATFGRSFEGPAKLQRSRGSRPARFRLPISFGKALARKANGRRRRVLGFGGFRLRRTGSPAAPVLRSPKAKEDAAGRLHFCRPSRSTPRRADDSASPKARAPAPSPDRRPPSGRSSRPGAPGPGPAGRRPAKGPPGAPSCSRRSPRTDRRTLRG